MTCLLDVNALVALAWPNHVHHDAVHAWFAGTRTSGWATCPLTEAGFVRVSCTPAAVRQSVTPSEAIALLGRLRRLESHAFWGMDRSITALSPSILSRIQGYRQITDAVLLALAVEREGQLATLDAGLKSLVSKNELDSVYTIPV